MINETSLTTQKNPSDKVSSNNKQRPEPLILKLMRFGFAFGGRVSPTLAGHLAYKLWFKPGRFKMPKREQLALETADQKTHQIAGLDIVSFNWGMSDTSKPLVLLVHGWSGRGTQLGSFVPGLLAAGYRVLSFDAPAHGQSSGKETSLYEVADVIVALQKHYGEIEAVITHSFGGPCLATAIQRGFTTNRIVSICPPATTKGLVEKFNDALHLPTKAANKMLHLIEEKYGEDIWETISMVNTVKDLVIPGIIIHDSNDIDIPWQEGKAVALAWNNAKFVKTSGLGHRRILRDDGVIETAVSYIKGEAVGTV